MGLGVPYYAILRTEAGDPILDETGIPLRREEHFAASWSKRQRDATFVQLANAVLDAPAATGRPNYLTLLGVR